MEQFRLFSNKIKWLSLYLTVLVVFIHSTNAAGLSPQLFAVKVETFITGNLGAAAVPMFHAISAFLFYRNFDLSKLKGKYKSRFRSVVIPFLFWNGVYMVLFYFLSRLSFVNEAPFDFSLPVIIDGLFRNRYNLAYWFMRNLILFILLAPVIYTLMRNRYIAWIVYACCLIAYSMGYYLVLGVETESFLFYLMGAYLGLHHHEQLVRANRFTWIYPMAFVLSQIVYYSGLTGINLFFSWLHVTLLLAANFGFASLIAQRELPEKLQCSFVIYTLHLLIVETLNKLFSYILPPASNWLLVDYFASALLAIGIIVVVSHFMKRIMPGFYKVVFGGR